MVRRTASLNPPDAGRWFISLKPTLTLTCKAAARWLPLLLLPAQTAPAQTTAEGTRKWAFATLSTATAGNIVGSPALAPDGTVYIGVEVGASTSPAQSGQLFAINPNGTLKWSLPMPDWVDATPAVGPDGTLYFGGWDGKFQAVAPDRTVKWTFTAGGFIASSAAIGADGTLYFGSGNGNLYALTPGGVLKWFFPTGDWIDSSPAIGPDGTIYFGSWDKTIYALRPDGTLRWKQATLGNVASSPAIASDGTVYVGSRDLYLYAFAADGTPRWRTGLGDAIEASPVIGADGTVYIITTGARLYALNPDGSERWRYPAATAAPLAPVYSTPAVRADGSIVLSTSNNALIVLRPDGTELWRAAMDDWSDSSPVIAPDGTIYVGCSDKKLYAFTGTRGPAIADWPQFRRDSQRRGLQPIGSAAGTTGRLGNLSVRTNAGTGGNTLIAGFVVSGSGSRGLLVRGVGPTLASFGVTGALANPAVALFSGATQLAANDDWGVAANSAQIASAASAAGAFPLPSGSLDAAVLRDFAGGGYTAQVAGSGGGTGIALMEAYDTGGSTGARLVNLSARSAVGTGGDILIAGFVVTGSTRAVLVRGIGPTLAVFGVEGAITDPRLQVYDSANRLVAENDNWSAAANSANIAATARSVGAFALTDGGKDAALLLTLPPGAYTAQVSGVNATTGVGLVEVYEVP